MIRKILLFSIVFYLVFWFTGAYLMKSKVSGIVKASHTDNIKLTHSGANISGFPFSWRVSLISPKLLLLDNHSSIEIDAQNVLLSFSFGLKKTTVNLGKDFVFNHSTDATVTKYIAKAADNLILQINTNRRIYEIDDHQDAFFEVVDNAYLSDSLISVFEQEEGGQENEVFAVKDFVLSLKKHLASQNNNQEQLQQNFDNILFSLKGQYKSDTRFFDFKSSNIDARVRYYFDDSSSENKEFDRMIDVQKLYIDFDDAFLDAKGSVKFTRADMPNGEFSITMKNHNRIINVLVPQDFIISQNYLRTLISKSIMNSDIAMSNGEQVKFEVKFSNKGLSIGSFNILQNNAAK